jgi:hypothetical protein
MRHGGGQEKYKGRIADITWPHNGEVAAQCADQDAARMAAMRRMYRRPTR